MTAASPASRTEPYGEGARTARDDATASSAPPVPIVETTRRDVRQGRHVVESTHFGHVVVLTPDGTTHALGHAGRSTFVRSAAKPFQAAASLEVVTDAGRELPTREEIAVGWASHRAEDRHLDAVRLLLERSGTTPEALTSPPAARPDVPGAGDQRLHHNCSGKHALFAYAGSVLGVPRDRLLDPEGALQQQVLAHLDEAFGVTDAVAVDGCGAPAIATPLAALAGGFLRLVTDERYRVVREAGIACPGLVGGADRLESVLLAAGVVAKPGAEGVFGAAWLDAAGAPWAVAVKVEDGASRASSVALQAVVSALGVDRAAEWTPPPVLGGGEPEGVVRPTAELRRFAGTVCSQK